MLNPELKLISNYHIREFTRRVLEKSPNYFWKIASSSTGKYHPEDENCVGGEVKHVKRVVKVANHLCECWDVVGNQRDYILSAAIMHDLCKNGLEDSGYTVAGHGFLWIELVRDETKLNEDWFKEICRLVACHMGRFDTPYIIGEDKSLMIIQAADYIASRRDILVEVEQYAN